MMRDFFLTSYPLKCIIAKPPDPFDFDTLNWPHSIL